MCIVNTISDLHRLTAVNNVPELCELYLYRRLRQQEGVSL